MNLTAQDWFVYSRINGLTKLKELYILAGLEKARTKRIVYHLVKTGAVLLPTKTKRTAAAKPSTPADRKSPEQPVKNPSVDKEEDKSKRSAKGKSSLTGDYIIPDRFLSRDEAKEESSQEEKLPTVTELKKILKNYHSWNLYRILGVDRNASPNKIREAFASLSKKYHPDRYFSNIQERQLSPEITELLSEIFGVVIHAYQILNNPKSRRNYDEDLWLSERSGKSDMEKLSSILDQKSDQAKPSPSIRLKTDGSKMRKPAGGPGKETDKKEFAEEKTEKKESPEKTSPPPESEQKKKSPLLNGLKKDKASSTDPSRAKKKWEELFEEGLTLFQEKKYKAAIEKLEESVKGNAQNHKTYFYLAISHLNLGKGGIKEAEENIKRALVLDRENPKYFALLAKICFEKGDQTMADRYLKTAFAWDIHSPEAKKVKREMEEKRSNGFLSKFLKSKGKKKK